MSHGLTAEQITATAGAVIRPIYMASLDFPVIPLFVHSAVGTISFDGNDYLGLGQYGGIQGIKEGLESRPYEIMLTCSGIPTALIAEVLGEHYQGRAVKIYILLFDEAHQAIGVPKLIWKGSMDYPDIELGETATVTVSCRSRMADWDRPRIRRYSHEDQQDRYPGDNCFKYVVAMVDKVILWGRS